MRTAVGYELEEAIGGDSEVCGGPAAPVRRPGKAWPETIPAVEAIAHLGLSGILLLAVIWLSRLCADLRSYLRSRTSVDAPGGRPTS